MLVILLLYMCLDLIGQHKSHTKTILVINIRVQLKLSTKRKTIGGDIGLRNVLLRVFAFIRPRFESHPIEESTLDCID